MPPPSSDSTQPVGYLSGFGNQFSSEARPGALPNGQNSPQRNTYGLYAEQFSGTAFTVPRGEARRTWLYRIRPSASHPRFERLARQFPGRVPGPITPNRLRWNPMAFPSAPTDLLSGLVAVAATHPAEAVEGVTLYLYAANTSMQQAFYSADGEWLLVPQVGRLRLVTELGVLEVAPLEIAVLPRGLKFRVELLVAISVKIMVARCACRTSVRSAATAWPTRGISSLRWHASKT